MPINKWNMEMEDEAQAMTRRKGVEKTDSEKRDIRKESLSFLFTRALPGTTASK